MKTGSNLTRIENYIKKTLPWAHGHLDLCQMRSFFIPTKKDGALNRLADIGCRREVASKK